MLSYRCRTCKGNQWGSTQDTIKWFKSIENKANYKFLKQDIESYYPSISKQLLFNALEWAKEYSDISEIEHSQSLVQTGDSLAAANMKFASHLCYLIAKIYPGKRKVMQKYGIQALHPNVNGKEL